ncbi:MAG: TadE/TadG family type IV pilus assembly protein [Myxococcota bacterium]
MSVRRARRGSNAIEFAMLAPVFLAILSGIVDLGVYFARLDQLSAIARDAARLGAVTDANDGPSKVAQVDAEEALKERGFSAKVSATLGGAAPDKWVKVELWMEPTVTFGLLPMPSTVHAEATMRLEDQE